MGALDEYRHLLGEVDALFDEAFQAHRSEMACKRGCSQCCVDPSIARVEVEALAQAIPTLGAERRAALATLVEAALPADGSAPARCVALGPDGACQIYEHRPMVCRYWGMVKFYPKGRPGLRMPMYSRTCWLNYEGRPMRKTEGDGLVSFDVDVWDARLLAVDNEARRERGHDETRELERDVSLSTVLPGLLRGG